MQTEAIRLVEAMLIEEVEGTGENASAYGRPELWHRVRSKLLTTYYGHCTARQIPPATCASEFHALLVILDDAWACWISPSRRVIHQVITAPQNESKQKARQRGERVIETAVGAASDAAALERSIDARMPLNLLRPVATRVQKIYVLKDRDAGEFVYERVVRVFLDVQRQLQMSRHLLADE